MFDKSLYNEQVAKSESVEVLNDAANDLEDKAAAFPDTDADRVLRRYAEALRKDAEALNSTHRSSIATGEIQTW